MNDNFEHFLLECGEEASTKSKPTLVNHGALVGLELSDLSEMVSTENLSPPKIRLIKRRQYIDPRTIGSKLTQPGEIRLLNDFDHILGKVSDGYTLIIDHVNSISEKCQRICDAFSAGLNKTHHANLYWSAQPVPGFGAHHDEHDLFVYQALGSKMWRFPDKGKKDMTEAGVDLPKAQDGILLCAGDLLFVKAGVEHDVLSETGMSVHLTISAGKDS